MSEEKKTYNSVWYFEDTLYLCWAWDKELIKKGDIAMGIGKSLKACKTRVGQLKEKGLFTLYKDKYESGDYLGADI